MMFVDYIHINNAFPACSVEILQPSSLLFEIDDCITIAGYPLDSKITVNMIPKKG